MVDRARSRWGGRGADEAPRPLGHGVLGPLADRCLEAESAFRRARARGERGPELDRLDDVRALAARRLFDQLGGAALVKRGRFALWIAFEPATGRASAAVQPLVDLDDDPRAGSPD